MNKVEKINSVTTDLIHFARPQSPRFKKNNIHKILDRTISLVKFKCIVQKVTPVREYAAFLPLIEVDSELMEQVALNLIDNALWAMPERGKLIIATRIFPENNFIEIKFADAGCGISRKDISRIFDPFFSRRENGTGLGLSIVHRIIEEHKGSIKVESELKKGTTFKIRLPTSQK
jgi:signal transduction histidine kinase